MGDVDTDAPLLHLEDVRRPDPLRLTLAEEPRKPDRLLQFFQYDHLPPALQEASKDFCDLAQKVAERYPMNAERTVTLRKLLEAKDAAVRTLLYEG
jgi:hypothetical protein